MKIGKNTFHVLGLRLLKNNFSNLVFIFCWKQKILYDLLKNITT